MVFGPMVKDVLYTTMIMTFTVGVDLGFVLGCFLLIFYHIASMNEPLAPRALKRFLTQNLLLSRISSSSSFSLFFLLERPRSAKSEPTFTRENRYAIFATETREISRVP